MAGDTHAILCGRCKVPIQGPSDGNDQSVFSCPSCGASDTRKEVLRIVAKHVQEVTARAMQEGLRKSMRGNKFIKLDAKPIPKRTYKFISDFKPKF